jgi:hypothetical protein
MESIWMQTGHPGMNRRLKARIILDFIPEVEALDR